jgi:hypothetical protein
MNVTRFVRYHRRDRNCLYFNKYFAGKIEDKNHRIRLKTTSYIVCIVLGIVFAVIGSLQTILNTFIED